MVDKRKIVKITNDWIDSHIKGDPPAGPLKARGKKAAAQEPLPIVKVDRDAQYNPKKGLKGDSPAIQALFGGASIASPFINKLVFYNSSSF